MAAAPCRMVMPMRTLFTTMMIGMLATSFSLGAPSAHALGGSAQITISVHGEAVSFDTPAGYHCENQVVRVGEGTEVRSTCQSTSGSRAASVPALVPLCLGVGVGVTTTGGPGTVLGASECTGLVATCTVVSPPQAACTGTNSGVGVQPWVCRGLINGIFTTVIVTCSKSP